MKKLLRIVLLGLVLAVVALVSALTAMRLAIHGEEVEVPDVTGMAPQEAAELAAERGLRFEVENRFYSDSTAEGRIMSQLPQPGTRVRRGWALRAAQSLGPPRATIPDVTGQSARAAEINIRRRGLEIGAVALAHLPDLPPGRVAAQSPSPGVEQVVSPRIDLLVAAPAPEPAYVMPDFAGHPLAEAARAVQEAGLRLARVERAPEYAELPPAPAPAAERPAPSVVVRQSPPPGQMVRRGAAVSFEVSR